jgi:hypothetical protein
MARDGSNAGELNAAPGAAAPAVTAEQRAFTADFLNSASQLLMFLEAQLDALRQADRPDVAPIIDACDGAVHDVRIHLRSMRNSGE